ncbi:ketopantoate reductase family protein [Pseudonocardia sp. WMMC193]|uniref:ketopantoate reductase family protein n=1 Tax=Pseudonocardia sp. WMMC193 TaxID=2911965 RepID=UPI001F2C2AEC|nr:2-dehydropantoate 2-reductase N-terminal domain-containing protein [Pseudonocardia sp. WMMC193]MCF7552302.1 ketopantoate reductase [Pseudonocardia sp. WMMC193]
MKVLMVGRGVIATLYGWALERAGHDVEFYVRPGRAAEYGATTGLDLLDARRRPWGRRVVEQWPVRLREELSADHGFDLIVLSVPHHRLEEAVSFLAPRIGNATVLVFGNVWVEPAEALGALPPEQLAWGFPQAGGGFGEDGVLHGALLPSVVLGTFGTPPTEREQAVRRLFREAGFGVREQPDLRGWLLVHFVSDAGLLSQGLRRGSLADMVGSSADLREALLTVRELLPLLEARGVDLRRHRAGLLPFRAPSRLVARVLSLLIAHVPLARASFAAHSDPDAREPREICRDVLADARRRGIPVPRLEASEPLYAGTG